jgi:LuxR family quorum sensing-dependent transcriptional regulator
MQLFREPPGDVAMSARTIALSQRECQVLRLSATGMTASESGQILGITKRTVDEHAASAVRKLDAANRTHAVVIAIRNGLISV